MSKEEELLREIFSKEGERPSDKKSQMNWSQPLPCCCEKHDCKNLATGNHFVVTAPVCRECWSEQCEGYHND